MASIGELETAQRLQLALKSGKLGTWQLDLPVWELTCSTQCKANFGRAHDDDFGYESFRESIHPQDRDRVLEAVGRAIANQSEYAVEYQCVWPDHSVHWINATGITLSGADGQVNRLIGTTQEITALKRNEENYRHLTQSLEAEVREHTLQLEARNAQILKQSELLQNLSQRLMRVQDEERRRIARELHDSAGQLLSALSMNFGSIAQVAQSTFPQIGQQIEDSRNIIQQLTQEIRTMSYLLHPPLLDEIGLSAALGWYIRGLSERSGLEISLHFPEDFARLPHDIELVTFRLVQECMTNIHRHSGSKTAAIRFSGDAENLILEVQDRGRGISVERLEEIQSQGSGVGIQGMRERVRQFHGQLKIASQEDGTTITFTLPIPPEDTTTETSEVRGARAGG